MKIFQLPMESPFLAHSGLYYQGVSYEILTGERLEDGFPLEDTENLPFITKVFRIVPLQKPLHPSEVDLAGGIIVSDDWRRDLTVGSLYVKRSNDEDEAALTHDDTIHGIIDGTTPLLNPCERLALWGLKAY